MIYLLISLIAGLLVELIFQLLKFHDDTEAGPPVPKYMQYDHYMSVQEFVASGRRRWGRYLFFRLLPPLLIFSLMLGIEQKYYQNTNVWLSIFIASSASLLPRDFKDLLVREYNSFGEKFVNIIDISSVYALSFLLALLASVFNFSILAPTTSGVVDNLWSTLFALTIIAFYNSMSRSPQYTTSFYEQNKLSNFVVDNYRSLEEGFSGVVDSACDKENCSKALIYSVLVFENMNRPRIIRTLEKLIVKMFHAELTIGVAQVRSSRVISDEESIQKAAHILKNTRDSVSEVFRERKAPDELGLYIRKYNGDPEYVRSIINVLSVLWQYAPNLF